MNATGHDEGLFAEEEKDDDDYVGEEEEEEYNSHFIGLESTRSSSFLFPVEM